MALIIESLLFLNTQADRDNGRRLLTQQSFYPGIFEEWILIESPFACSAPCKNQEAFDKYYPPIAVSCNHNNSVLINRPRI
jgi:hypothetical protein